MTAGVVLTTLSASKPKANAHSSSSSSFSAQSQSAAGPSPTVQYATGIAILSLALVFSGALGLMQDWTYNRYTRAPAASVSNGVAVMSANVNGIMTKCLGNASGIENGNKSENGNR